MSIGLLVDFSKRSRGDQEYDHANLPRLEACLVAWPDNADKNGGACLLMREGAGQFYPADAILEANYCIGIWNFSSNEFFKPKTKRPQNHGQITKTSIIES